MYLHMHALVLIEYIPFIMSIVGGGGGGGTINEWLWYFASPT